MTGPHRGRDAVIVAAHELAKEALLVRVATDRVRLHRQAAVTAQLLILPGI
jgi:hypothetical protein